MEHLVSPGLIAAEKLSKVKDFLMNKDDKVSSEQATDYLFRGFRILGMELPARFKIPYIFYSIIVNGLVTIFLPLSFSMSYTKVTEGSFEMSAFLTSLQVAINVWGCSVKVVAMAFMMKQLRACNVVTTKMDLRCKQPDEIHELHKLRTKGRRYFVLFALSYWSYATSTFVAALAAGRPPYSLYLPYLDWRRTRWEFVTSALIEFSLMWMACFQQVVDDSFGVIYVRILRTHLKILKLRIGKLGTNHEWTSDEQFEELKLCIKDHKNYIELFDTVAPVVSVTLFIQFTLTATIIGITLINMFIFSTALSSQIACLLYVWAVVVEIVPLCYHAQCLIEENNTLCDEIFYSHWIGQDMRFRKMLVFYIQQTQRPMQLTAGKIFLINLNTTISIAKFSFSLYTFIRRLNIKERFNL